MFLKMRKGRPPQKAFLNSFVRGEDEDLEGLDLALRDRGVDVLALPPQPNDENLEWVKASSAGPSLPGSEPRARCSRAEASGSETLTCENGFSSCLISV